MNTRDLRTLRMLVREDRAVYPHCVTIVLRDQLQKLKNCAQGHRIGWKPLYLGFDSTQ